MAGLNYVTFNQDHSLLAVATTRGLRVYNTDPFELTNHSWEDDISLLEQLFSTSLVAMVLTPRLLRIVNTKKHSTICELTFHGMVVAVKMNRKRLVVMLEEVLFIYDISNMKLLHQQLTPLNPSGIVAVSPNSENNYLALPHYQKTPSNAASSSPASHLLSVTKEPINGDVLLYDLNKMEEVMVISAHQAPLSAVALNSEGTLLATASEKGTVIRIFSVPDGRKLYQFRRGSMPARIYCMSFNATGTLLCVSSATETVHIFKLAPPSTSRPGSVDNGQGNHNNSYASASSPPTSPLYDRFSSSSGGGGGAPPLSSSNSYYSSANPDDFSSTDPTSNTSSDTNTSGAITGDPSSLPNARQPRQPGFMSLLRRTSQGVGSSLVTRAAGYLPSSVTEMWEPQRDFAWLRVPRGQGGVPVRCVVAMANHGPQVMVATGEGEFLVYSVDLERGGEGTLVKRFDDIHGLKHRKGQDGDD